MRGLHHPFELLCDTLETMNRCSVSENRLPGAAYFFNKCMMRETFHEIRLFHFKKANMYAKVLLRNLQLFCKTLIKTGFSRSRHCLIQKLPKGFEVVDGKAVKTFCLALTGTWQYKLCRCFWKWAPVSHLENMDARVNRCLILHDSKCVMYSINEWF